MNATSASTFDPQAFLDSQLGGEQKFSTKFESVPEEEYNAMIMKITGRSATTNEGVPLTFLDVTWRIDAPGMDLADKKQVRQSVHLDFTPDGMLSNKRGENVYLGQLLEALSLNGKPWSPRTLESGIARIKVTQRVVNDPTSKYHGRTFSDVKKVTRL